LQKQNKDKNLYWNQVAEAAGYVKKIFGTSALTGIITGTGLSGSLMSLEADFRINYSQIPHFPVSTVESHPGCLLLGSIGGRKVVVMQGRFHLYEGYSAPMVAFPVRIMQALGIKNLVVTNAAGGLCKDFAAGDIMAVCDHINLTGENPLVGPNNDAWGIRFPDMSAAYDSQFIRFALKSARKEGIILHKGVYAGLKGPSLETPAELRYLKQIGADAVGLSTVTEVIAAVHGQMRVCGLSMITNIADPDHPEPATIGAIIKAAEESAPKLGQLISDLVREI
jgi:purine-nucleoside phosphorylase